jgi:hypothetical protein
LIYRYLGLAEQNCHNMKNKNIIQFLGSIILMPMVTTSIPVVNPTANTMNNASPQVVLIQKQNIDLKSLLSYNQAIDPEIAKKQAKLDKQGEAIDAYFGKRGMPLEGLGRKMAEEADKYELDWRLIPAIAVRESTGGKFDCNKVDHNPFGWGSCRIGFKSAHDGIETIARNISGNNPKTAKYYGNKNVKQILQAYNPPSIVPKYADQVISIMNAFGDENLGEDVNT